MDNESKFVFKKFFQYTRDGKVQSVEIRDEVIQYLQISLDYFEKDYRNHRPLIVRVIRTLIQPGLDLFTAMKLVEKVYADRYFQDDLGKPLLKSTCSCGQPVLIEHNARTSRADGKRIFYPDEPDNGWCVFRCKVCHRPINETVPGAEYVVKDPASQKTHDQTN